MKSSEVREKFLSYFEAKGHKRLPSSSLIPKSDPTLMFTNAGMNQFKNIFLGLEESKHSRATTCQKCCRVSGKHNDFEMVGKTPRHHTFFEMLGNFSFGDYFKKEAIEFAYELIVKEYGFPLDSLYFTVFKDDDEAYDLWKNHIGIPENRIYRYDEKENFWAMGETGPCGPCSEIHYDFDGDLAKKYPDAHPASETDRFIELWNLVFMQFNKTEDGKTVPLAAPSVDTGAGLERIATVLQGRKSNYHSDLFMPIIKYLADKCKVEYEAATDIGTALQVMADHVRAATFLIGDGLLPSNEGRGYVLRRIIRRGIRFARKLDMEKPFLYEATGFVISMMKDQYPELTQSRDFIARVTQAEEERFNSTISFGMGYFTDLTESASMKKTKKIPGKEIFKLYDTYGLPIDFTRDLAEEAGFELDEAGFQQEMEKQRLRARQAWKGSGAEKVEELYVKLAAKHPTEFRGYDELETDSCKVLALIKDGKKVDSLEGGDKGEMLLDRTPFYGESGGQVGDTGILKAVDFSASVKDAVRSVPEIIIHRVEILKGKIKKGEHLTAVVDAERRANIMRNHTVTHLLHAALREELGTHVKQSGSLVAPDRVRFDFTHFNPVGARELRRIEDSVNEKILKNIKVEPKLIEFDRAVRDGAIALFDEKYGEEVRMIKIDNVSKELCGGTHVSRTGDIGLFKILSESSVAAGIRRIEGLTGWGALKNLRENLDLIDESAKTAKTTHDELPTAIEKLMEKNKQLEKENKNLKLKLADGASAEKETEEEKKIGGVNVVIKRLDHLDAAGLREYSDRLKNRLKSCIIVLGAKNGGKALLTTSVSGDLTGKIDAVSLIRSISGAVGGGGGGRPDMAQAGGKKPEKLDEALSHAEKILKNKLEG